MKSESAQGTKTTEEAGALKRQLEEAKKFQARAADAEKKVQELVAQGTKTTEESGSGPRPRFEDRSSVS